MEQFDANLLECRLFKVEAVPIWIANEDSFSKAKIRTMAAIALHDKYSYVEESLSLRLKHCASKIQIGYAERYGGLGIGAHAGGGRSHIVEGVQVKGSGANFLVGETTDKWHSHGTLNLTDAVIEIINSHALDAVLPQGVAQCLALLSLDADTSYNFSAASEHLEPTLGVLLLREALTRPANLLPARYFIPRPKSEYIKPDSWRIKRVMRELINRFPSANLFISYLGQCLQAHADQFAYARIHRIAHGTLSPSNLALNGKWLDLTNSSFVPGGQNILLGQPGVPSFFGEFQAPVNYILEVLYTYGKYTRKNFHPSTLKNYYFEQYNAYLLKYFSEILGVSPTINGLSEHPAYISLFELMIAHTNSNTRIQHYFPVNALPNDPVHSLIISLFLNLSTRLPNNSLRPYVIGLGDSDQKRKTLIDVLRLAHRNGSPEINFKSFVLSAALTALKRSILPTYFYLGRSRERVKYAVENGGNERVRLLIDDAKVFSSWFYQGASQGQLCIFKTSTKILYYEINKNQFLYIADNAENACSPKGPSWASMFAADIPSLDALLVEHYLELAQSLADIVEDISFVMDGGI